MKYIRKHVVEMPSRIYQQKFTNLINVVTREIDKKIHRLVAIKLMENYMKSCKNLILYNEI